MDYRKVTTGSADSRGAGARADQTPPLSQSDKKLIEQGKAAVVDGKLVESNVGKVEGRS